MCFDGGMSLAMPVLLTLVAVAVLMVGDARAHAPTLRVAKPLASTGFLVVAVAAGGLHGGYGRAILVALALSWVGDVCLLSRRPGWFLAGLTAFLAAHVAFGVAFVVHGVALPWALGSVVLLAGPALGVRRWLSPHLPAGMRGPVDAYVVVITVMVALSLSCAAAGGSPWIAVGAIAFYLSDLSVARDRFVRSELRNRLWGLPLYYGAQLVLACTIAT
jgi:uncharacterized membrane protein YhhN